MAVLLLFATYVMRIAVAQTTPCGAGLYGSGWGAAQEQLKCDPVYQQPYLATPSLANCKEACTLSICAGISYELSDGSPYSSDQCFLCQSGYNTISTANGGFGGYGGQLSQSTSTYSNGCQRCPGGAHFPSHTSLSFWASSGFLHYHHHNHHTATPLHPIIVDDRVLSPIRHLLKRDRCDQYRHLPELPRWQDNAIIGND